MDVRTAIASILKEEGVEFISCFPENPLIDAFASVGIRPVICRSERVVVNIADGYSRVSPRGKFGVAVMQYGPGIENAYAGVAQAFADSVPVLILPGRFSRRQALTPPDFDAVTQLRGITKSAVQVSMPDRAPTILRRAVTALRNGRGGPVLIEVPTDVATAEIDLTRSPYSSPGSYRTGADPADIREAAERILSARRPVVLAGQGIHWAEAWSELLAFAELTDIPVATTVNGKSAFPEDHPLSLGTAGQSTTGMVADHLPEADLVVAVGTRLRKWWMAADLPPTAPIIHLTLDDESLNRDYPAQHAVLGDAKLTLAALTREIEAMLGGRPPPFESRRASIAASRDTWLEEWAEKLTSDSVPLNPYRVLKGLDQRLDPSTTLVTHESGSPREAAVSFITSRPRSYVGWGHSSQLGYSLGLAMGMKLAQPERDVFNIMGDAAFGMTGLDLETAVRNSIGIITVLLNNGSMGNYEKHMPVAVERYSAKQLGGNYADVAQALGAAAWRITDPSEIDHGLDMAIKESRTGRPALLEFITAEEPAISGYRSGRTG